MADGIRKRNIPPSNSRANGQQAPASQRANAQQETREKVKPEEYEEIQPELFKFSTWPSHVKRFPIYAIIVFFGVLAYNQYQLQAELQIEEGVELTSPSTCSKTFRHPFLINRVRYVSEEMADLEWEVGIAAQAQIELLYPDLSVFGPDPFPDGEIPKQKGWTMNGVVSWAQSRTFKFGPTLSRNNSFSATEPAALGIWAVMAGQSRAKKEYLRAARLQKEYLLDTAPRFANGAISHRVDVPEVWAEAIAMFPPFLAYYGVSTKDEGLLRETVRQIQLYRDTLRISSGKLKGAWKHSVGPTDLTDAGAWSIGNALVANGIARVRATISKWPGSKDAMKRDIALLDDYIAEIIDAAITTDSEDSSGLLHNYLGNTAWFGETSGTALLAATVYRMAVLRPEKFGILKYLNWADAKRLAVSRTVDDEGYAQPAANILYSRQIEPTSSPGSHQGASFVVMMAAAHRDCVCGGLCVLDADVKIRATA